MTHFRHFRGELRLILHTQDGPMYKQQCPMYNSIWPKIGLGPSFIFRYSIDCIDCSVFLWATRYSRLSLQTAGLLSRAPRARSGAPHFHARATRARSGAPPPRFQFAAALRGLAGRPECQPDASYTGCPPPPKKKKKKKPGTAHVDQIYDTMRF